MTDEEVDHLMLLIHDESKVSQRNKLIIHLLLYTGIRVSELVSIKLSDIDLLTSHLMVTGKGGKRREIGLRSDVLQLVRTYLKEERSASVFHQSDYLLVTQRSENNTIVGKKDMINSN